MKIINVPFLLILLTLAACSDSEAQNLLSPKEFEEKLNSVSSRYLLDVRTKEEFNKGHLKDAANFDYYDPQFRDRIKKLDRSQPVFIYCQVGGRSARAVQILLEEGFTNVYELKGGIENWMDKKLLTVK